MSAERSVIGGREDACEMQGRLECVQPIIRGWLAGRAVQGADKVELKFSGRPVVTVLADLPRPDVEATLGLPARGFEFRPQESLLGRLARAVVVTAEVDGQILSLPESPTLPAADPLPDTDLFTLLEQGHQVSAKSGSIFRPLSLITEWPEVIGRLYSDVRMEFMEHLGLELFAGYGTLLGIVREGRFLAHDDDFDAYFLAPASSIDQMAEIFVDVGERLGRRGWGVHILPAGNMHVGRSGAKGALLDIFVMGVIDGRLIGYEVNGPIVDEALRPRPVELLGTTYVIPQEPELVLETIYGRDWRTPNPAFQWRRSAETGRSMAALEAAIKRRMSA